MSRKYNNPPLVEAVCEFQFNPESEWDIAVPGLVYERLKGTFPIREPVPQAVELALTASVRASIQPEIHTASDRVRFLREDKKALVQVGPHLLSANHLQPYPTWEEYLPMVKMAYDVYREVAKPQGLRRIGLRYINRINIPGSNIALQDYFEFHPYLGPDFPEQIGPFIVGVQIFYDSRDVLRVQLANAAMQHADYVSMVLDLDYSLIAPQHVEIEAATEWLQVAHDRVEQIFEACLTDQLRSIFEEDPK
jgi:uncharacterized protein (TIGR04255 family)